VRGFHHVAIQCADLGACERFYREVLGLEVLRRWPRPGGGDRSVWLAVGDGFLALERAEGAAGPAPARGAEGAWRDGVPGPHLVALRIARSERASWEARLASRGVPVAHRTRFTIYLRDPEGNRVGLSHWPDAEGSAA
jgi:catechol 2,3-dioxygenase-like lactoylglutathione lyase family enzyme